MNETLPFWSLHAGDIVVLLGVGIAYIQYRLDSNRNKAERQKMEAAAVQQQANMHAENQQRLNTLAAFHEEQLVVNRKRDEQIGELKTQTATLTQIANGLNRRLEMLEDR